jgi:hypothetical protein
MKKFKDKFNYKGIPAYFRVVKLPDFLENF